MELGALGRGRRGCRGRVEAGLLPLWPGCLWHSGVPGGPTETGGREGHLWTLLSACDIQALQGQARLRSGNKRDMGTATSAQAGTCPRGSHFPNLALPRASPASLAFLPRRPPPRS